MNALNLRISCKTPEISQDCEFDLKSSGFRCGKVFDKDKKWITLPRATSKRKVISEFKDMTENDICEMMGRFHSIAGRYKYDKKWSGSDDVPFPSCLLFTSPQLKENCKSNDIKVDPKWKKDSLLKKCCMKIS